MPLGYLIARSFIANRAAFELRQPMIASLLRNYGGRYLARTRKVETIVGGVTGFGMGIIEYPTLEALHRVITSPEVGEMLADIMTLGSMDLWGVPGVDTPGVDPVEHAATDACPRGYLVARASVSGHRRIQRPMDLLSATVKEAGGRILIRSGQVQIAKSQVDVNWLTVIEMPTFPQLKAALPAAGAPGTDALYKSMEVEDLWIAPGLDSPGAKL